MARVGRARRDPNLSPCGWLKQTTGSGVEGEPTYSPHFRPLIHGSGLCGGGRRNCQVRSRTFHKRCEVVVFWHTGTTATEGYRADYFLGLFSSLSEGQLNQETHGCRQFALHHDFGASPADMGAVEELPGCLSVGLDHGLQGPPLHWVLHSRDVHAKIRLLEMMWKDYSSDPQYSLSNSEQT